MPLLNLVCSWVLALLAVAAQAATLTVPGSSPTIQGAINLSSAGDTILVGPGTYPEAIDFLGKDIQVRSAGGPSVTTIAIDTLDSVVRFMNGETRSAVLDGFTLTGGRPPQFPTGGDGGGVYVGGSSPTIINNVITGNVACNGGGIGVNSGSPLISDNTISGNRADCSQLGFSGLFWGGGIALTGAGTAVISGNTIVGNTSDSGSGIGMFAAGTPTIINNTIGGNTSTDGDCRFFGGTVWMVNDSDADIVQNVISSNHGACNAGVVFSVPSGARGPALVNNTIALNVGPGSSGIFAEGFDAAARIVNNLVAASPGATAMSCTNIYATTPPVMRNNLFYSSGGTAVTGLCASQVGVNGNLSADPLLDEGSLHFSRNSPAIDAGLGTDPLLPSSDFDGMPRVQDGDGDGSARIDIGAFEAAPPPPLRLIPVVASGLASPIFVTHAGDGTHRLFIAEQGGTVRVLRPGTAAPTLFLDIRSRVLSGGERGLLGLAFHPHYASNGRFFVYYTRAGDGAVVIAEYRVSTNPNVATARGTVLLTIAHPINANHNGGMLAFGADGYLYIGVGDGGSGNDPPNNAQNIDVLLGKILRIDVDHPNQAAGTLYSSPSDNPYVGTAGRDEIFSIGWRNPWRFSFDRSTHQQWVADVGQDAREEVDTPIVKGGNYGWRVFEGASCTGNAPTLCNPANFIGPVFDYSHSGGRCSITGGYVYRGAQGALALGAYVYGDFCSGEIFTWDGIAQRPLIDTPLNISSFGEDEDGELYVVGLGGTVHKIAAAAPATCANGIAPTSRNLDASGGGGNITVTAGAGCAWTATANAPWIHASGSGSGSGAVSYSVDANSSSSARTGTATIAGFAFSVNQAGTAPCTYAVSPTRATFPGFARSGSVTVTAQSGCSWSAFSNAAWITIVGIAGNAVNYAIDALPGRLNQRSGTMTVAGKTVTIVQSR